MSRSVVGTDHIYAMDATLTATTKCGQQVCVFMFDNNCYTYISILFST